MHSAVVFMQRDCEPAMNEVHQNAYMVRGKRQVMLRPPLKEAKHEVAYLNDPSKVLHHPAIISHMRDLR